MRRVTRNPVCGTKSAVLGPIHDRIGPFGCPPRARRGFGRSRRWRRTIGRERRRDRGDHQPRVADVALFWRANGKAGIRRPSLMSPEDSTCTTRPGRSCPIQRAPWSPTTRPEGFERPLVLRQPPNPVRTFSWPKTSWAVLDQTVVGRAATRVMAKSSTVSSTPRSSIRPRVSLAMSFGKSSAEMTAADARN